MATSTSKKKTTSKKTVPSANRSRTTAQRPVRREVWSVVCFFVGLFSFIGYFNVDAWFITYFCGFIKGLIGGGYYVFPAALLLCAYFLLFHRGRPVRARTTCMLCVPAVIGALWELLFSGAAAEFSFGALGTWCSAAYSAGLKMHGGGVVAGLLGETLKALVSVFGAVPLLFFGLLALLMGAFRVTPQMISERVEAGRSRARARERLEYDPADYQQEQEPEPEPVKAARAARTGTPTAPPAKNAAARSVRHAIDIPMDAEPPAEYEEKHVGFFNVNPRVKTPAQAAASMAEPAADDTPPWEEPIQEATEAKTEQEQEPAPSPAVEPTQDVAPLTVEEAAAVAGVSPASAVQTEEFSTETVRSMRSNAKKAASAQEIKSETEAVQRAVEEKDAAAVTAPVYHYPPVELLRQGKGGSMDGREEMRINRERLQTTLDSFSVSASITDITRGPTVTRYDLELEAGVKLAKLTNLAGDLALALGVTGVRIAPIPDKISTVGVEVPNKIVSTVYLRDIIDTPAFRNASSKLSFALGKDIGGNAIVGNIAKLPHLLIAGTTGSGKSVCMNSLILSLLYKSTPEEVRLIMIDPKMVELGVYNGIPHLYIPVVTDPKKAAGSLQWAVVEMLKRYRLFSEAGVRELSSYNALQRRQDAQPLPQVVIVIDELADLMLVASKEVEESICRVAQMGRAAGMHLVIATQRPSADVITGLMKANIPSRIAFAVSSAMESRIILDQMGAEKLVGSGDMLYAPIGIGKPTRIQGAFVTDEEREEIVGFIKQNGEAEYNEEILYSIEQAAEKGTSGGKAESAGEPEKSEYDELLPQAVDVIFETKQASVSMLQRRLKLGYSRAARIVDQMEELGVVGPFEGSKPRQILLTREQWQEMQTIHGTAPTETLTEPPSFADFQDAPVEEWEDA